MKFFMRFLLSTTFHNGRGAVRVHYLLTCLNLLFGNDDAPAIRHIKMEKPLKVVYHTRWPLSISL